MSRTRGRSILLIEDSEDVVHLLVELLKPLGVRVAAAGDGASALRAARDVRPDLILADLHLPDTDGLTTVRLIKEAFPDLARTPVVVITGHANPENIREAVELGVIDFLVKPAFLSKAGLERIRRALESAPPKTERRSVQSG
jgi:two-component system OmpR family response regulator